MIRNARSVKASDIIPADGDKFALRQYAEMDTHRIRKLAADLVAARKTMMPVPRVADLTKSDAAQVKEEVIRLLSDNGRRQLRGYKVSLSRTWGAL